MNSYRHNKHNTVTCSALLHTIINTLHQISLEFPNPCTKSQNSNLLVRFKRCPVWGRHVTKEFHGIRDFNISLRSVSYTHLDVYKRQQLENHLFTFGFFFNILLLFSSFKLLLFYYIFISSTSFRF